MGKFCTSCGTALNEGAKFCAKCGANASPALKEVRTQPDQVAPNSETVLSKVGKQMKTEAKSKTVAYAKSIFSEAAPAYRSAGELALPSELVPATGDFAGEGLLSLLKSGFRGLAGSFKKTLGDKKRLGVVIALAIIWLFINLLAALDIFPLPLQVLSWLTAARGSLIGGSIGKGLVAALFARLIADKGMLKSIKSGMSKLVSSTKSGKQTYAPLLMGAGAALMVCNLMISSNLQNTMVCVAGFTLSARALTRNGFLRRLIASISPKMQQADISAVMQGWALGFAAFAAVSFLPGGKNGYLIGVLLLIVGGVLVVIAKNSNKEVSSR